MANLSLINLGSAANDGTGDPGRTAFTKTNAAIAALNAASAMQVYKKRVPASNRLTFPFYANSFSTTPFTSATGCTYRLHRSLPAGLAGKLLGPIKLRFWYTNTYAVNTTSVTEAQAGAITIALNVLTNTSGTLKVWGPGVGSEVSTAATISSQGTTGLTLKPGENGWIEVSVPFVSGAYSYYESLYVSGAAGWPLGLSGTGGTNSDAYTIGADVHTGGVTTGWTVSSPAFYAAYDITAETAANIPAILGMGHSQMLGTGNTMGDVSYLDYACGFDTANTGQVQLNPAMRKLAIGGDRCDWWLANSANRVEAIGVEPDFSRIMWHMGTNDLANSVLLSTLKTNYLACLAVLQRFGKPITLVTITPRTTSGNVPITVSYSDGSTYQQNRAAFNTWLSTLIGTYGVDSVYDPNTVLESTTTPGAWKDIMYTQDFVHLSGGAIGSGTSGIQGTLTTGGGQALVGNDMKTNFFPTISM